MNKIAVSDLFIGDFPITQIFGVNASYYSQFGLDGHEGVDWGMPNGTPLFCPFDEAIVVRVVKSSYGAYGKHIVLWDSKQKAAAWFCHCKTIELAVGDVVYKHNLIAYSDNTGNTTGPHLHWSICRTDNNGIRLNQNNGYFGMLNPNNVVEWRLENPIEPTKGDSMNKDLETCLKQHTKLVEEAGEKEEAIEAFKSTISSQATELTKYKKAEKVLIDKLEDAGDKLISAEALKTKWYNLYKQSQKNCDGLKIDYASCQRQLTNLKKLKAPTNKFLKKLFLFILAWDQAVQKAKQALKRS